MFKFAHDIAGGQGNLIATSLQSPDFETGVQGWQVRQDGSVEFNNGTFRGYVVDGGMFLYSGTPGDGNPPVISITNPGTTEDPYGNTILPDLVVGQAGMGQVQIVPGNPTYIKFPAASGTWNRIPEIGMVTGTYQSLFVLGGADTAGKDFTYLELDSGPGGADWVMVYADSNGNDNTQMYGDYAGVQLPVVSMLKAVEPGTGTSTSDPAVPESWHTMPSFNTHFSHGSPAPAYKLNADSTVSFAGEVAVTSGTTSGTVVTLPSSAYFPQSTKKFAVPVSAGTPATSANVQVTIDTSGDVILSAGPTGAAYDFAIDGIRYPLDY